MPNRKNTTLPPEIMDQIGSVFAKHHLPLPYTLYRTIEFTGESPHNLLPSQRKEENRKEWTVYIAFKGAPPTLRNIDRLIVFPDNRENELPLLSKVRLGKVRKPDLKKADLAKIPEQFVIKNLEDLDEHLSLLAGG